MEILLGTFSSISVLLVLISGVMLFKRSGILTEEYGQMCSTLIMKVTLPALILVTVAHAEFSWDYSKMNVLLMTTSAVCLGLGWLIARAFRIDEPGTMAVILTTGFSSSGILGVPLISELFPDNKEVVANTVVLSTQGMYPFLITVGTMIAAYFGAHELPSKQRRKAMLSYFRSPIFLALVFGIVLAPLTHNDSSFAHSVIDGLRLVSSGNSLMVLLVVGLFVKSSDFRKIAGLAVCVGFVNLIVMPLLLMTPAHAINLPHWEIEVLTLEGAMPAAMLSVVICSTYGGDARLAAKLVLATIVASSLTIPVIFLLSRLF